MDRSPLQQDAELPQRVPVDRHVRATAAELLVDARVETRLRRPGIAPGDTPPTDR